MIYQFFVKNVFPITLLSFLTCLFFNRWHNLLLGGIVLVLYFLFVSSKTQFVLVNYFSFNKSLEIRLIAAFLSIISLGWLLGIFIFFNYFNSLAVSLSFFMNGLVWSLVEILGIKSKKNEYNFSSDISQTEIVLKSPYVKIGVIFYFILLVYGFYLLVKSKTGSAVFSPWQVIDSGYILVFLVLTFLLSFFIIKLKEIKEDHNFRFSKLSAKTLLFFIIIHSFLLHSYLPLTHELFYGADGWRHIANEARFMEGKDFLQAKLSDSNNEKSIVGNIKSKVGLLSYGNFWGINAVLAKILNIDLIYLTKWFLPVVWSVIFTILLYEIGLALGWSVRNSLFLAWAGTWPFALQASGSFSLPVNLGFLLFLLLFLLLLKTIHKRNNVQKNILLTLGFGSAFGYLLFFILFWLSWGMMVIIQKKKKSIVILGLILASFVLPILELTAKSSSFNWNVNIFAQIKQFMGNIFGFYLASGPRPHDIETGNILFNQIPASVFTPNFLTQFRWWLPTAVLIAAVFIILGIKKNIKDATYKFILAIFNIFLTSYFLSFYLLGGERLLSRRLDAVLAFLFLILLFYGLKNYFKNKYFIASSAVILSIAITASYSLGPDTSTVKTNELEAATYVWSQEKNNYDKYCVLADTLPLLALEAVSKKEIIGGGFPIDANFAQLERVGLYKQMNTAINDNMLRNTVALTKTDHCWMIGKTDNLSKQGVLQGSSYKIFGDVAVVRYYTNY